MTAELRKPTARTCERCGRREEWDGNGWVIVGVDGERQVGDRHCIHEWDINGAFNPFGSE